MSQSGTNSGLRSRSVTFWLAVIAAVSLILLYIDDVLHALSLDDAAKVMDDILAIGSDPITLGTVLTWIFWVSFIALSILLLAKRREPGATEVDIDEPAWARFLFHNSHAGLFWLPIRLFLAFAWLSAGLHKIVDPAWRDGTALAGFWTRAVEIPDAGRPAITYDWYRDFIQTLLNGGHESWFTWVIMLGEIAVGIGLLFGILTGIAAFFGALMNMAFLLSGSASTNPVMFTGAIGVILAWRVAGFYGVDRYLLPMLGTPWRPGPGAPPPMQPPPMQPPPMQPPPSQPPPPPMQPPPPQAPPPGYGS